SVLVFFRAEDGIRDGHVTGVQTCPFRSCARGQDIRHTTSYSFLRGPLSISKSHFSSRPIGGLMSNVLPPGTPAPDFTLPVTPDQKLSLRALRGQPVILAFYPADWSPVCGDQTGLYNEILPEFQKFGAEL